MSWLAHLGFHALIQTLSAVPVCALAYFAVWRMFVSEWTIVPSLLDLFVIAELAFWAHFIVAKERLQNHIPKRAQGISIAEYDGVTRGGGRMRGIATRAERWENFVKGMQSVCLPSYDKVTGLMRTQTVEQYLCGWFSKTGQPHSVAQAGPGLNGFNKRRDEVHFNEVMEDNVMEFLAWGFFLEDFFTLTRLAAGEMNCQVSVRSYAGAVDGVSRKDQEYAQSMLKELREMVDYMCVNYRASGMPFTPGYNPNIKALRTNLDEFTAHHKPLVYYLAIGALHGAFALVMRYWLKFKRGTNNQDVTLPYWYSPALKPTPVEHGEVAPIVFQHGIGAGIFGYATFLVSLVKMRAQSLMGTNTEHPDLQYAAIFVLEMPCVSTLLFPFYGSQQEDVLLPEQFADQLQLILVRHGEVVEETVEAPVVAQSPANLRRFLSRRSRTKEQPQQFLAVVAGTRQVLKRILFVGHSLGSTFARELMQTQIVKNGKSVSLVKNVVLVDPVAILLHHSDVAYNFVYREPTGVIDFARDSWRAAVNQVRGVTAIQGSQADEPLQWNWVELILHAFAAKELYVSWTLGRCLYWHQKALFKEDVPADVHMSVVLGEEDAIVNSRMVRAYLCPPDDETVENTCVIPADDLTRFRVLPRKDMGTDIYYYEGKNHAHFLFNPTMEQQVLQVVLQHYSSCDLSAVAPPQVCEPVKKKATSILSSAGAMIMDTVPGVVWQPLHSIMSRQSSVSTTQMSSSHAGTSMPSLPSLVSQNDDSGYVTDCDAVLERDYSPEPRDELFE